MPIVYFLILQLAIAFIAYVETQPTSIRYQCSSWRKFTPAVSHLGSHLKVASCLLLPAIQLVVGISHSSWIFLPFFICSCVSLVDWSLTSNFLCLFRWWRSLLLYACFSIIMLYLYQLPVELPKILVTIAEFIGLYKISSSSDWPEIVSSLSLLLFFFMVLLLALSLWSFSFASICAFGLLAYVGYILYAFPSLFHLHRLNGLLLIFILLWAASTYVFNMAFTLLNKSKEDMEIWETIGLWHYPIPGLYLFSQFCLRVLVAIGNLVNDSVFLHLSNEDGKPRDDEEDDDEVICFLVYLLSHSVSRTIRQALVLLCEAHFVVLYILQLGLISKIVENGGSLTREILFQLGRSLN